MDLKTMGGCLKRNWYFPVSAAAFFVLNITMTVGYLISIPIALIFAAVTAAQTADLWEKFRQASTPLRILAGLTAIGICWGGGAAFYDAWSRTAAAQQLEAMLSLPIDLPACISVAGAVCSAAFVFYYVLLFWQAMVPAFSELFCGIKKGEAAVYGLLLIAALAATAVIFAKTDAFYGTVYTNDIIYTSDSPALVRDNVYLSLAHQECDFRQPLFAVFAAPFLGIPYLISRLLGGSATVEAIALNCGQIVMLFAANFLLAKLLKLTPGKRICFMILSCCTYGNLLFALMMEQYIVACFWLIFCVYQICEKGKPERLVLWGAGGSLLTSMILLPAMSEKHPLKQFKGWFADMVKHGLGFVAVMLAFSRFEVFYNLASSLSYLSRFTGQEVTAMDKVYQYTEFVRNCFAAPVAGVNTTAVDHISWQLEPVTSLNWIGIGIFVLAAVSAVWNWKNKSSRMAAMWVGFSVVMLFVLGWGTAENGLILYALYFGWAFLALLFQLAEKIGELLHIRHFACICSILAAAALLAMNIPAIGEMLEFAVQNFPV